MIYIKNKKIIALFLVACFYLFAFGQSEASTLQIKSDKSTVNVGDSFTASIVIDTEGDYINASQSVLSFPKNILEVISVDKAGSVFNFWVEEPNFSNENGTVSFIGGTTSGLIGVNLSVLKINFKAKDSGLADLRLSKSVITANDGEGTNVLRVVKNTNINISKSVETIMGENIIPTQPVIETPVRVEREAVLSGTLPDAPVLRIPLYPESGKDWYNYTGETLVFWDLPDDITKVAIDVDKNPNTEPQNVERELFTGKNLGILKEGINYIHVQFKNNIGWGKVSHIRIAIDTTSPIAFDIRTRANISDDPTPEINFVGSDSLSGYLNSLIFIDGEAPFVSTTTTVVLSPLKPGKHSISVKVFDKAGNSIDDGIEIEVLPIDKPVVDFITNKVSLGENIYVYGKGLPSQSVDYTISKGDVEISTGSLDVDILGKWELSKNSEDLGTGSYNISFISRDTRGAQSFPTEPISFRVGAKTVLSLGFVDLTLFQIIFIVLFLVIVGGGTTYWFYISEEERRKAYKIILGRDIKNISDSLDKNLSEMETMFRTQKRLPSDFKQRAQTIIKEMQKRVGDMKKYLTKTINKS